MLPSRTEDSYKVRQGPDVWWVKRQPGKKLEDELELGAGTGSWELGAGPIETTIRSAFSILVSE